MSPARRATVVSVSRRTDIPAFYGDWFRNRLRAGYCLVPNPFNPHQVRRVELGREDVGAFVFWTRDPSRFVEVLDELDQGDYPYVVLFTLTGYGPPLEVHAPPLEDAVAAFRRLAGRIGPQRVVWRYDPVVLGPGLDVPAHLDRFAHLAGRLAGSTTTVKISFVDLYQKTKRRLRGLEDGAAYLADPVLDPRVADLVRGLAATAANARMRLQTCAEERDFSAEGAVPGSCIDAALLRRLFDLPVPITRDPGQRPNCRCAPSLDIGTPDTCCHGCVYCYATRSHQAALRNRARHDPTCESLLPLPSGTGSAARSGQR